MANTDALQRKRLRLLLRLFVGIISALVVFRVGYWMIIKADWLREKASLQWIRELPVEPQRGNIEDRHGNIIAASVASDTVVLHPQTIAKDEEMQTQVDVNLDQISTFSSDLSERFDLHGFHIEEGLPLLDKFLDKAYMAKMPQVYVVHGAGTGAMRDAVMDFLKKHPHVKAVKPGEKTTVAYLR